MIMTRLTSEDIEKLVDRCGEKLLIVLLTWHMPALSNGWYVGSHVRAPLNGRYTGSCILAPLSGSGLAINP